MNPDFTEANSIVAIHVANVTAEQDAQAEFTRSGYVACPLSGSGTLKRAVDVYHSPEGEGYVVRFVYELDGKRWCRCEARGPQSFRTHNWMEQRIV